MPDDNSQKEVKRRDMQQLLDASSIGWMFPIAIGLGFLWGWGMDKLFGTRPWLTAIFTAFGVIAAFINLFRIGLRDSGGSKQ
ncbi:MAG TPA: AtpZ/AtpI family protein [Thermoanaerobaculia bacterium]